MMTELQRMQIIGDEFPLPLVEPAVIAKMDSVVLAVERAVRRETLLSMELLREALREVDMRAGAAIGTQVTHMERDLIVIAGVARQALGPNVADKRQP